MTSFIPLWFSLPLGIYAGRKMFILSNRECSSVLWVVTRIYKALSNEGLHQTKYVKRKGLIVRNKLPMITKPMDLLYRLINGKYTHYKTCLPSYTLTLYLHLHFDLCSSPSTTSLEVNGTFFDSAACELSGAVSRVERGSCRE